MLKNVATIRFERVRVFPSFVGKTLTSFDTSHKFVSKSLSQNVTNSKFCVRILAKNKNIICGKIITEIPILKNWTKKEQFAGQQTAILILIIFAK
jgi:hypothetical protein